MTKNPSKLNHKEELAIAALLKNRTIGQAAKEIGIAEQTLWRWLQKREFYERYRSVKRQVVDQAVSRLQSSSSIAVDTLEEIMLDSTAPQSCRVSASKATLDFAIKAVEVEEIESRIVALEDSITYGGG